MIIHILFLQIITGIFQEITKHKVKKFMKEKYGCEIVQGGPREYPEITSLRIIG